MLPPPAAPPLEAVLGAADVVTAGRIAGVGPPGALPLTREMLVDAPSGNLFGLTQNVAMRNVMVASLALFLVAALVLKIPFGNLGLWLSLHLWFAARGGLYWWALERRRTALFA